MFELAAIGGFFLKMVPVLAIAFAVFMMFYWLLEVTDCFGLGILEEVAEEDGYDEMPADSTGEGKRMVALIGFFSMMALGVLIIAVSLYFYVRDETETATERSGDFPVSSTSMDSKIANLRDGDVVSDEIYNELRRRERDPMFSDPTFPSRS